MAFEFAVGEPSGMNSDNSDIARHLLRGIGPLLGIEGVVRAIGDEESTIPGF